MLAEPSDERVVNMLESVPLGERELYADEGNVVDLGGISGLAIQEATDRFAFVGGERSEYIRYFHRTDLPAGMWNFALAADAKALAGFSAVAKKDGIKQCKRLMAVTANLQRASSARRLNLDLHGVALSV